MAQALAGMALEDGRAECDFRGMEKAEDISRIELEQLFGRLARSRFRSRFHLNAKDRAYADSRGRSVIASHAADFIEKRLAPAAPRNDGKQTPMRGHPVFVAQHATGCCCRGCLGKWHGIPAGRPLTEAEQARVRAVLMAWIDREMGLRP